MVYQKYINETLKPNITEQTKVLDLFAGCGGLSLGKEFRKWAAEIAWESEVWIAESPEHMIHFNGYKFLEIHK